MPTNVTEYATMKNGVVEFHGGPPIVTGDGRTFFDAPQLKPAWFDGFADALWECWADAVVAWEMWRD